MGRIDKPVIDKADAKASRTKERPKTRKCLMCNGHFHSTGVHNRICKRCKSTQAWREGRDSDG